MSNIEDIFSLPTFPASKKVLEELKRRGLVQEHEFKQTPKEELVVAPMYRFIEALPILPEIKIELNE
jgi:Zn-dependent membrane protease YugP